MEALGAREALKIHFSSSGKARSRPFVRHLGLHRLDSNAAQIPRPPIPTRTADVQQSWLTEINLGSGRGLRLMLTHR